MRANAMLKTRNGVGDIYKGGYTLDLSKNIFNRGSSGSINSVVTPKN